MIGNSEHPLTKEVLPCVEELRGKKVEAEKITFEDLLSHCSGLPAWRSVYKACSADFQIQIPPSIFSNQEIEKKQEKAFEMLQTYDFFYEPRSDVMYSDIGFMWLGFAISAICNHQPLHQSLHQLVFLPLNLSVCFNPLACFSSSEIENIIAPTEICQWRQRRLKGEVHDENAFGMGGVSAHAGLFGTAKDVASLANAYLYSTDNNEEDSKPFKLSPNLVQKFTREKVVGKDGMRRGLGWMMKPLSGSVLSTSPCGPKFSDDSFGHTGKKKFI